MQTYGFLVKIKQPCTYRIQFFPCPGSKCLLHRIAPLLLSPLLQWYHKSGTCSSFPFVLLPPAAFEVEDDYGLRHRSSQSHFCLIHHLFHFIHVIALECITHLDSLLSNSHEMKFESWVYWEFRDNNDMFVANFHLPLPFSAIL